MTSLLTSFKQNDTDGGFFVNLADCTELVYTEASAKAADAAGDASELSSTVWSGGGGGKPDLNTSAGTVFFKDMGRTIDSGNGLTLRKVQLVSPTPATFGVGGPSTAGEEYYTGYILLALNGADLNYVAPVAKYGR